MTVSYGRLSVEQMASPMKAPITMLPQDVSVVVPVGDNPDGISRLVNAIRACSDTGHGPRELIIVDDGSREPLSALRSNGSFPIKIIRQLRVGPASARNEGAKVAAGSWLLFTDSDCEPTTSWIKGFIPALNGSIAYAGGVRAKGSDQWSQYYDSQCTLIPPPGRPGSPAYLITANALVWKEAFDAVSGFDERFPYAAGEDIDFGLRLWRLGDISYALDAVVIHDFEASWPSFFRRFLRYGRGNQVLAAHYRTSLRPTPFRPREWSMFNALASFAQYAAMALGYEAERIWKPVDRSTRGGLRTNG